MSEMSDKIRPTKKLRIAQISKADAFGGGASRVAEDLTDALSDNGHVVHHFCSWSGKGFNAPRKSLYGKKEAFTRRLHTVGKRLGFPEYIPFELSSIIARGLIDKYDIFHFHDLSSAISPNTLSYIARFKPVVWTFHDCSPFTGGCLYPMGCENFKVEKGCGSCPQIGQWPIDSKFDFTRTLRNSKARLFKKGITPVTPSHWMADMAMSSQIVPQRPHVISNGINTSTYQAYPKKALREELGIPKDRMVVLLSAGHLEDERKGTKFALQVLKLLKDINPFVVVMGQANEQFLSTLSPLDYKAVGYVSSQEDLNRYYSLADLFLFCSLADNQPLSIIEALCSGTPVAGFATGGIPEQIKQEKTGFLVENQDIAQLASRIKQAFESGDLKKWSKAAAKLAPDEFSALRLAADHEALYLNLLSQRKLAKINA